MRIFPNDVYIYHSFRKENGKSSSRIYKKTREVHCPFGTLKPLESKILQDAVITNPEGDVSEIIKINKQR